MTDTKFSARQAPYRFRNPNRRELVAMWIWGAEYARGGLGAVEFYERLNESRKRQIAECIKQFEAADA